jgi:serine acetyltransferase
MSLKGPIQVLGVSIDETAPRPRAVRGRGMTWLQLYRSDIARYRQYRPGVSPLNLLFTHQGLWALLEHRIASGVNNAALPPVIKRPCLYALEIWQKAVEILTGISISCEACIGPGFYIGHFGPIFIGKDAIIGAHCSISHGVTIGESGRGTQRGTPRLGDRVLIGANAVLAGKLSVGNDAVIAPNSLVIYDVSESSVMMGVPAKCFSMAGSRDIVPPELDYPILRQGYRI